MTAPGGVNEPSFGQYLALLKYIRNVEAAGLLVLLPDDELWAQMERVLVAHQRHGIRECLCGWSVLGMSHPGHQVDMLLAALAERPSGGAG